MSNIFNRYLQYNGELPSCVWNPDFSFVPYYKWDDTTENNVIFENEDNEKILEISSLSQIYRIVFFAICKYFSIFIINPPIKKMLLQRVHQTRVTCRLNLQVRANIFYG